MTFRFAGFVLTVFPHVECNRLVTNWGGVEGTSSCSCSKDRTSCSEFCGCRNEGCRNKWNMMRDDDGDNDSDNDDPDDENNE